MPTESLPEEILYLKPALEFYLGLSDDDIHEDTDVALLDESVSKVVNEYGDSWQSLIERDSALLEEWLETTAPMNDSCYFVLPFLENYERGQKSALEQMEESRLQPSGLFLEQEIGDVVVEDAFYQLNVKWKNGTNLNLVRVEDECSYDHQKNGIGHHEGVNENRIDQLQIGDWKITRLILLSRKPFFWKQVEYFLACGDCFVFGHAIRGGKKDFDVESIEKTIEVLKVRKGEQGVPAKSDRAGG